MFGLKNSVLIAALMMLFLLAAIGQALSQGSSPVHDEYTVVTPLCPPENVTVIIQTPGHDPEPYIRLLDSRRRSESSYDVMRSVHPVDGYDDGDFRPYANERD